MKRRLRVQLSSEQLEDRFTPAIFGTPWADARHLTASFVADGTDAGGQPSNLFQTLDSAYPRDVWQRELLRSMQIWSTVTNISIGLVADGGQALGTSGSLQGDPRFGDIRIAARPMSLRASAVSVPPDPFLSGTWAGDIVLNSSVDWRNRDNNLCGLMLHEVGHALGLEENNDPKSVMYRNTVLAPRALSNHDITAIRNLYGVRPSDAFDVAWQNNSLETASPLTTAVSDSRIPWIAYADLTNSIDADFYSVDVPTNYIGPLTVQVVTAGISLLAPTIAVLNAAGEVVDVRVQNQIGGSNLLIQLPTVTAGERYHLKVSAGELTQFSTGRYSLAVTFDAANRINDQRLQTLLCGPFDNISPEEFAELLHDHDPLLLHDDHHTDDSAASAAELIPTRGLPKRSHYDAIGSLSDVADIDLYRFEAPEKTGKQQLILTVGLTAYSTNGVAPKATVLDSRGRVMSSEVIANDFGQYSIQVKGAQPGRTYYVKVQGTAGSVGNYSLAIDSRLPATTLESLATGQIPTADAIQQGTLYVAQNQLFHLTLTAGPIVDSAADVQMTVLDTQGNILFSLVTRAGETASADTPLLTPGEYQIRVSAIGISVPIGFSLRGQSISDPAGPMIIDPTADPLYLNPDDLTTYLFPFEEVTSISYLWIFWLL